MPSCLNAARSTEKVDLAGNPPPGVFICLRASKIGTPQLAAFFNRHLPPAFVIRFIL
jgi:hypothetical protein